MSIGLTIIGTKMQIEWLMLTDTNSTAFSWATVALHKSQSYVGQPGTSKWRHQVLIVFVKAHTKRFVDKQQAWHTRKLISTLRQLPLYLDNVLT
jgi:E3 ubiquitin-protein ligase DOA10